MSFYFSGGFLGSSGGGSSNATTNFVPEVEVALNGGLTQGADDSLSVKLIPNSGLTRTDAGLGVNIGSNLSVSANGKLNANIASAAPILQTNSGLQLQNQELGINHDDTLQINQNKLGVNVGFGLEEDNNHLQVKTTTDEGLQATSNGLSVLLGKGLGFDATGRVTILLQATPALSLGSFGLSVLTGDGIWKVNNFLSVKLRPNSGLELDATGLTIPTGGFSCLEIVNSKLQVGLSSTSCITRTQSGLEVDIGQGLFKNSINRLEVLLQPNCGLIHSVTGIANNLGDGIEADGDNKLRVKIQPQSGLLRNSTGIRVNVGNGLEHNANQVSLKLQALSGLEVNSAGLTLNIQPSSGLQVTSTGLNIDLTNDSGLQKTNDGLKVRLGNNLSLDSQGRIAASVTSGSGVVIAPVDPGGLKLDSQSRISLGYSTGLTVDNNGNLAVRATRGVTFFGGNVAIDTGFGLGISNDNKVAVNLPSSSGLISDANGLAIHVGNGLRINSGNALDLDHRFGTGARKLTGEYIDGKRIYKKYYNFRMPSTNQGDITIESDPCYMIIDYGGVIQRTSDSGQWHMIRDIYTGVGSHESLFFMNTNNKVYLYRNVSAVAADYRGRNCRTWITYAVN